MSADHPARRPQTQQERLAAAARALAAAEEAARHPSSHPGSGDLHRRSGLESQAGGDDAAAQPEPPAHFDPRAAEPASLDVEGARQVVLRQLTMGPRSRRQLEDKLRQRGCPHHVAVIVLDRMTAVGLVDDQAYAEMLVRSKQAGRGLATRALAQELRLKGVDDELVAHALGSIDPQTERARAEELAARKMRTMSGLDPQVQSRRLSGMLARKGYPSSVVHAVVRDIVNDAPEHQRD